MRRVFRLSDYTSDIHMMHCNTEEKANAFLEFLTNNGRKWCDGESYIGHNNFNCHRKQTCYCFNEGSYASLDWAIYAGYIVLEYDDFDWCEEKPCKFMSKVMK